MTSRSLAVAASFFLISLLSSAETVAQSLPTKKEAAVLLQKASDAMNLRTGDTPPFQLLAHVNYEIGGKSAKARYELFWASPSQNREDFEMNSSRETQISSTNTLFISRNTSAMSLPFWSIRRTLRSVKGLEWGMKAKINRVYSTQVGGNDQLCIDFDDEMIQRVACLDPASHALLSFHATGVTAIGPFSRNIKELKHANELELGDFVIVGAKSYPRHIVSQDSDERIEIQIDTIAQVTKFEEATFAPPTGAMAKHWCVDSMNKGSREMDMRPILTLDPPGAVIAYYVLVGTEGQVKKWEAVRSGGSRVDEEMALRLRSAKFAILSCEGTPIEYETMVYAPIAIRLH